MITPPHPVCVLDIKLTFLLVIQHTQCPRWFFILERYKLCGHKNTTQAATSLCQVLFFFSDFLHLLFTVYTFKINNGYIYMITPPRPCVCS